MYSLSNRQRKELTERGRELRIALPCPPDDEMPEHLVSWAASILPYAAGMIARVVPGIVIVRLDQRPNAGLSALLGPIIDEWCDDVPCAVVQVVVAHIKPARVWNDPMPVQWPGGVVAISATQ